MKVIKSTYIIPLLALSWLLLSCSTQKNTSQSRWWHAFNAHYNTYYNATVAYVDGSLEKEQGHKDNYTELLPLYTVSDKNSRDLGKNHFQKAIEKCEKAIQQHSIKRRPEWTKSRRKTAKDIEWLNRREYNPFLWKAWLLMGRSQFHSGQFEEAASTFAYMSRLYEHQPAIYGRARAWLAKCYIEQDWLYDAEDVIRNMQRDSIHWRAQKEWDYTYADYYIHRGDYTQAIPYLRKVIGHEMRHRQKAREWYILGQLLAATGRNNDAHKAFQHVIRLHPPYELQFNARIAMTEVMAGHQWKPMVARLKRMALSDNNKEYLDQVYYAIGNIYLAQKDTTAAIAAYEQGNTKATRAGIEKGVLLLHLGDLYWTKEKFGDARRCYGEAIGLLDKERKDYDQLSKRSKILDELVPYTDAVHLQDSLQALVRMDEKDRNEAIDRVITALKKKEKEERYQQVESQTAANANNGARMGFNNMSQRPNFTTGNRQGTWYFYNPMAVSQGKIAFERLWGKRENVDNWQRSNKTVVATLGDNEKREEFINDSLTKIQAHEDSIRNIADSIQNNPHHREYYLARLPFTPEQLQASNALLEDGLFHSGIIFKDKLDNLPLSEKVLLRLVTQYSDYEHIDEAYYHLYLLYARKGDMAQANNYLNHLKTDFPKSRLTALLSDPYFQDNARQGEHVEDSLYAATYEAFKADRYTEVFANSHLSNTRFPLGANRDKFLFIEGMSYLNQGNIDRCIDNMKMVVKQYPESRLAEMAGMIINGVDKGKHLHGAKFDLDHIWTQRKFILSGQDSTKHRQLTAERNVDFRFMLVYHPDSVNENRLLFELARFNFTSFLVRNFEITTEEQDNWHRMSVTGFRSYDEALQYARQLYKETHLRQLTAHCHSYLISESNLQLLDSPQSYINYERFYTKHYAPLKTSTYHLLTEPLEITTEKQPEPTAEEIDKALDENQPIGNTFEVLPQDTPASPSNTKDAIVVEEPTNNSDTTTKSPTGIVVPTPTKDDKPAVRVPSQPNPTNTPTVTTPRKTNSKSTDKISQPATPAPQQPAKEDTGIYFDDDFGGASKSKQETTIPQKEEKKQQKSFDLEDEYYDLDGF